MIDFLWGLAGALVAMAIVSVVLRMLLLRALTAPASLRPSTGDKVIGFVIGVITIVLLSGLTRALFGSDPSPFVEQLSLGAGLAVVFDSPDFVAPALGHRVTEPKTTRRTDPVVPPVHFSEAVRAHFAEPESRARYVLAAYRQGLIPADDVPSLAAELAPVLPGHAVAWRELASGAAAGLDDAVDRAAREIGYAPTPQEARTDVVERLIYMAMISTDPMVRLATVHLLAPPVTAIDPGLPEWDVRYRIESRRHAVVDAFAVRYDDLLTPGVRRHFEDPTVRARELIAGYRRGVIHSPDVPQLAAEIVADLPGAGEAWTELAMASGAEPRSELRPILERAAEEIGYSRNDQEAEEDLLEAAAYRAIVTGRVMDESERLHRLDEYEHGPDYDYDHRFDQGPALEALRDAQSICGEGYYEQIASVRTDLAAYLNTRYP